VSYSFNSAPRAEDATQSTSGLLIVYDPLWSNLREKKTVFCTNADICK
jgi:hypothetical protein